MRADYSVLDRFVTGRRVAADRRQAPVSERHLPHHRVSLPYKHGKTGKITRRATDLQARLCQTDKNGVEPVRRVSIREGRRGDGFGRWGRA
jgi:hypothetical protein